MIWNLEEKPEQILESVKHRIKPTVVTHDGRVVGYANLYGATENSCYLGKACRFVQ